MDDLGRASVGSNFEEAAYTVPQVNFPLFEDFEGGTANWAWGSPWGPVTTTAHSTTTSFADSPLGSYENNANTALTTFVSLVGSSSPVLTFWHRPQLEHGKDFVHVEVSQDSGQTWTTLLSLTGFEPRNQERIDLNDYTGGVIGLRFRLQADGDGPADGVNIDDIRIANSAVSAGYPFSDDAESGLAPWLYDTPWGQTMVAHRSTSTSWTDSPESDYANNIDASLELRINLGAAIMPVLEFWHRYSFQKNADFGYVEVSIDGGANWNRVYFVTGGVSSWVNEKVDLTEYAGQANVRVRFRVVTDGSGTADGWEIDDVIIAETTHGPIPYPFHDDVEPQSGPADNWLTGSWEATTPGHDSPTALNDSPQGNYIRSTDTHMRIVLASTINLANAINPRLSFWHDYDFASIDYNRRFERDRGRVYVSNFFGKTGTWEQVASFTGSSNGWVFSQVDLSDYVGLTNARVTFTITDDFGTECCNVNRFNERDGWLIDDIRIQNAPTDVVLNKPANVTMHGAGLSWSQNNDSNFDRYEVYRALNGDPTTGSTLVTTIGDQSTTSYSDTYAVLQNDRYHYGVFVVDDLGQYSVGSNAERAVYTVPQVAFPFFDDAEGGTASWEWSAPWGQVTSTSHSADTSWADSPAGSYDNNANTALTTFVSLATADSPVLTFWHKPQLERGKDFLHVEVSEDGGQT